MRHVCLYIGVQIFIAGGRTGGLTRGSTRGPRGPKKGRGLQTVSDENSHKRGTALGLFCDEKWNISATDQKGFEMPHIF